VHRIDKSPRSSLSTVGRLITGSNTFLRTGSREYTRDFHADPSQFVLGMIVGGRSYALPMQHMRERLVHNFAIDGKPLVATFSQSAAATCVFSASIDGHELSFEVAGNSEMREVETDSR
jgi:hypothetical protein